MNKKIFKSDKEKMVIKKKLSNYLSWTLTDRQICDLELLLNGAFNPLNGFLKQKDYNSVINNMRLSNGDLFPIPITLDVSEKFRSKIKRGEKITLRDKEGFPLAILTISDIWKPDLLLEAELVYGSVDHRHPAVNFLLNKGHKYYVGGKLDGLSLPRHFSFSLQVFRFCLLSFCLLFEAIDHMLDFFL